MLELVGRYRVETRIGEGAMADVYRAHDPSINRVLAIKVLKAEFRQNNEYAQRFLREAKAAGALSHPHIVTIYDVGEVDGYPYIAMELLDGEPLSDVMQRQGRMSAETTLAIGEQLGDALRYAHAQGVVHRDIKPSNIMLSKDGLSAKILDFGIARVAEADSLLQTEALKTQVGQVLGTPRYMSPEQALGREIDGRSDLFSVGVVLYEMVTGKRAFAGGSAATLALQITQEDPEPIAAAAPDCPRGLQFIINKLLAKRPDRRFADGGQLVAALKREARVFTSVMAEAGTRHRYLPLPVRISLMLASVTAVVLVGAISLVLSRQDQAMERVALASGSAVASFVASNAAQGAVENAALPAAQRDWLPTQAFVKSASEDPDVQQLVVVDADGVVQGSSDPALVGKPWRSTGDGRVVLRRADLTVTSAHLNRGDGLRFTRPILYAGRRFGEVVVTLSKGDLDAAAALSRVLMVLLGAVTLGAVAICSYTVARHLAQPIRRLRLALTDAARGDLDFQISHNRNDEFGELFDAFNRFTSAMQERLASVESLALDVTRPSAPPRPPSAAETVITPRAPAAAAGAQVSRAAAPSPRRRAPEPARRAPAVAALAVDPTVIR